MTDLATVGSEADQQPLIHCERLGKIYRAGEIDVPVLSDVTLRVDQGEFVAIMGTSGSGKTTLMNLLGCLDQPSSGSYRLEGRDVSNLTVVERAALRSQKIGFVFQSFNLLPRVSALENVMMPLAYAQPAMSEQQRIRRATELLERVGLSHRLDRTPAQLSGGEQQRVAIARALVNTPQMLLADEPTGNLDSKTTSEILDLFEKIHDEGLTILLVTHDRDVGQRADRIVQMRDGRVDEEQTTTRRSAERLQAKFKRPGGETAVVRSLQSQQALSKAWFPQSWTIAVRALGRNMVRSALTTLGVVIGVAAVIAMMEIGKGSEKAVQNSIASMGANAILILPGSASSGGVVFGFGTAQTLTPDDADAVLTHCDSVSAVAPIVRARCQILYGSRNWVPVVIAGSTPSLLQVRDWQNLQDGEMFTDGDVRSGNLVCLVGTTIVRELFEGRSPVGEVLRIQNVPFRVIGVLSRKGANMMGIDQDDLVLAPWTAIKYRVSGVSGTTGIVTTASGSIEAAQRVNSLNQRYLPATQLYTSSSQLQLADTPQPVRFTTVDQILVKARDASAARSAATQISGLLRERHHIQDADADDFNVQDMSELTQTMSSVSQLIGKLLLAVALISLVVGGVGIMNIMLVSVTERTREIGLRMSVGASPRLILRQFLEEAVLLCVLGGIIGVALGRGCSALVRGLLQWPTELSIPAIVASVAVSVTVGVVFGFYPALKAARLRPIDALRYE